MEVPCRRPHVGLKHKSSPRPNHVGAKEEPKQSILGVSYFEKHPSRIQSVSTSNQTLETIRGMVAIKVAKSQSGCWGGAVLSP